MKPQEIQKVQTYLQKKFACPNLTVKGRPKMTDSVEVFLSGEFIGIIYHDDDEGEISYQFQMCIIEEDLE